MGESLKKSVVRVRGKDKRLKVRFKVIGKG
jgi:hypothetical protein